MQESEYALENFKLLYMNLNDGPLIILKTGNF